jgi:hypothetical protein
MSAKLYDLSRCEEHAATGTGRGCCWRSIGLEIGGQEVAMLLRPEIELAIEFAAMKTQVECALGRKICG